MAKAWFPSPYPVVHYSRRFSETQIDPDTGNEYVVDSAPVIRYVQEIAQRSSDDVMSGEFQGRTVESLIMSVDDPENYSSEDRVIINPVIENDTYTAGTGTAYWVNGNPSDQRKGPWSNLFDGFGGVVQLRRVT
jgi:hypothetical protein